MRINGWIAAAAAALMGGFLAGYVHAQEKRVVTFLAAQYSPATEPYWKEVEESFEKAHPEIDVQIEVFYWKGLHDKITTLIGASKQPDIAIIGTSWLPEYVNENVALAIDDRLTPEFRSRFVENLLQGAAMNGKSYGLPIATSVRALYYNKDHLAEAGLEPPKTWEELHAAAKALTKPGRYGLAMPIHPDDQGDQYTYFLFGAGGDWFDADDRLALNSPAAAEALEFMVQLHRDKVTQPEPWSRNRDETQRLFIGGRASMMMSGNFLAPIARKENANLNYGVTAIPSNKAPGTLAITDTLVFFKRPAQDADAVWTFIEFAWQEKWREEFMKREGMLPELRVLSERLEEDELLGPFVGLLPDAKFQPNHEHFMAIAERLVKAVHTALLGTETPQSALDKAVKEIETSVLSRR